MISTTKRCAKCERTLPITDFHKNRRRKDGLQTYCRDCQAVIQRDWYERRGATQRVRNEGYRARNTRHLWDYLANRPCVDCGEADPVVLEFDHVRGDKIYALSDMAWRQFSIAKLDAEIAKCEVRCANCHKRKTAKEQGWHSSIR